MRVITEEGSNLGVLTREEALKSAAQQGKDLVLVVPESNPPVAKILDYKKFLYTENQKHKKSVAGSRGKGGELKELRFRPGIGQGDLDNRIRRAHEWLEENNKVKFTLQFQGREFTHPEVGLDKFPGITKELADAGSPEGEVKRDGKNYSLTYLPIKVK